MGYNQNNTSYLDSNVDTTEYTSHLSKGFITHQAVKSALQNTAVSPYFLKRRVVNNGGYMYIGLAQAGSLTSDAVWMIARTDNTGNQLHADGNTNFDNIFDNALTTVVYS